MKKRRGVLVRKRRGAFDIAMHSPVGGGEKPEV